MSDRIEVSVHVPAAPAKAESWQKYPKIVGSLSFPVGEKRKAVIAKSELPQFEDFDKKGYISLTVKGETDAPLTEKLKRQPDPVIPKTESETKTLRELLAQAIDALKGVGQAQQARR